MWAQNRQSFSDKLCSVASLNLACGLRYILLAAERSVTSACCEYLFQSKICDFFKSFSFAKHSNLQYKAEPMLLNSVREKYISDGDKELIQPYITTVLKFIMK